MSSFRTATRRTAFVAAVVAAVAAVPFAAAADAGADPTRSPLTNAQVKVIKDATKQYRDVDAAVADGYLPTDACSAIPGVGGMGYHYFNPGYASDGVVDPRKPEVLLYHAAANGELVLGGVEYFAADADQDPATADDRPYLYGQPFDGPMLGHEPGMPVHYDLHVWLYTKNPNGLLDPWNPRVTCGEQPTDTHVH